MDDLITVDALKALRGAPDLRVLDATFLPFEPERDAAAEYRAGHIPGALLLDLKTLCDPDDPLPSTVPSLPVFAARMAALGVTRESRIVLYDNSPHRTAARAWWLLRLFGARHVALLDGGFAAWTAAGEQTEAGPGDPQPIAPGETGFRPPDAALIRTLGQMRALIGADGATDAQVVDARGAARFTGEEGDPRPGVAPGHMPGALNLPYKDLFAADGRWKDRQALAATFAEAGVTAEKPLVFTCGSGITAAGLMFGAHLIGRDDSSLYDGSWSEWGAAPETPKRTGAA